MSTTDLKRRDPRRRIDWTAAVGAGVIASAGFLVLEMLLDYLFQGGTLGRRVRLIAAIALGEDVLPPPDNLELTILLTAIAVHLALSVVFAILLAWLILRLDFRAAEIVGLAFGFSIYVLNFYVFVRFFPWFASERGWVSVVTHLAFGAIAALEYKALARPRREAAAV